MPKEDITDFDLGNTLDELLNLGETTLPATAGEENVGSFDLSMELAEILATFTPSESTAVSGQSAMQVEAVNAAPNTAKVESTFQGKRQLNLTDDEKRRGYRHRLHWRVAIINKGQNNDDIYHGRTHDISLTGVSILIEHNVTFTSEVVVLLEIPPIHLGQKKTLVEVQCNTTYTLLDSVHSLFRLGMRFVHFKGDGKRVLSDILSKRHIPKEELKKPSLY